METIYSIITNGTRSIGYEKDIRHDGGELFAYGERMYHFAHDKKFFLTVLVKFA